MKTSKSIVRALVPTTLALFASVLAGGCDTRASVAPAEFNVNGTWRVSEKVETAGGQCSGEVGSTRSYELTVSQDGNALSVTSNTLPGLTFEGMMDGDLVDWSGSFPDEGGQTATWASIEVYDPSTFSGTATWTWSGGGITCSGTTTVTGTRVGAPPPQPQPSQGGSVGLDNAGGAYGWGG